MSPPLMLLASALVVDGVAIAVGFGISDAPTANRVGGALVTLFLYGTLVLLMRKRTRVVAFVVTLLALLAVATNMVSPNGGQLVVAVLSLVSAALAVAAYLSLRTSV